MDGPLVVRVICLQVVVVERVDAGQLVLHLAAEFLWERRPWPVRSVAPQGDVESPVGELRSGLRMLPRCHLPSRAAVVAWQQPDCLPRLATVPLVKSVWFAGQPQGLPRELPRRHLSAARQPFASARQRRLQVRKSPDLVPGRRQDPETWMRDCWHRDWSLPTPKTSALSRSLGSLAFCSVGA